VTWHGFVLDTTVDFHYQRRGIGSALLREAMAVARDAAWLGSTSTSSRLSSPAIEQPGFCRPPQGMNTSHGSLLP